MRMEWSLEEERASDKAAVEGAADTFSGSQFAGSEGGSLTSIRNREPAQFEHNQRPALTESPGTEPLSRSNLVPEVGVEPTRGLSLTGF